MKLLKLWDNKILFYIKLRNYYNLNAWIWKIFIRIIMRINNWKKKEKSENSTF